MTTSEYDRTVAKLAHLRQIGMSVSDYANQLNLFEPELNDAQLGLLFELDAKQARAGRSNEAQPGLF